MLAQGEMHLGFLFVSFYIVMSYENDYIILLTSDNVNCTGQSGEFTQV